jgi:hypothetical protein
MDPCSQDGRPCRNPCEKILSCNHQCKKNCSEKCEPSECKVLVEKVLPCGHKQVLKCNSPVETVDCKSKCRDQLPCGHSCSGSCNDCLGGFLHMKCKVSVPRAFKCGHQLNKPCHEFNICNQNCKFTRFGKPCKSKCSRPCFFPSGSNQDEISLFSNINRCTKALKCRHQCVGLEGQSCPEICPRCNVEKFNFFFPETTNDSLVYQSECGHMFQIRELIVYLKETRIDIERKCPFCDKNLDLGFETEGIFGKDVLERSNKIMRIREKLTQIYRLSNEVSDNSNHILTNFSSRLEDSLLKSIKNILEVMNADKMKEFSVENTIRVVNANNFICLLTKIKNFMLIIEQEKLKGPLSFDEYLIEIGLKTKKYLDKFIKFINEPWEEMDEYQGDHLWMQLDDFLQKIPQSIYDISHFKYLRPSLKLLKKETDLFI